MGLPGVVHTLYLSGIVAGWQRTKPFNWLRTTSQQLVTGTWLEVVECRLILQWVVNTEKGTSFRQARGSPVMSIVH
jgi:hypothetical protein